MNNRGENYTDEELLALAITVNSRFEQLGALLKISRFKSRKKDRRYRGKWMLIDGAEENGC